MTGAEAADKYEECLKQKWKNFRDRGSGFVVEWEYFYKTINIEDKVLQSAWKF